MEVTAIKHLGAPGAHGRSPLLRLQSDDRLVSLARRGNQHAFEVLVARYQSRLLAFCRHLLGSREDAEDVLQEVFTAAFNAMLADNRPINVRPWLYRIARNRSLNHLRRAQPVGVDSMDVHFSEHGLSTAEQAHRREDFRLFVADVQELPESQRTALLMREMDALSYEQIAEEMDNTIPSVKSLLVRARVSLSEAAEARRLDCEDVRFQLGEVAEGLRRLNSPMRRHLRGCERCGDFKRHLALTNRALAALVPVGPLVLAKQAILAHLAAAAATATSTTAVGGAAGGTVGTAATKAAAGLAAAAIVTAGAVEFQHATGHSENSGAPAPVSRPVSASPAPPIALPSRHTPAQPAPAATIDRFPSRPAAGKSSRERFVRTSAAPPSAATRVVLPPAAYEAAAYEAAAHEAAAHGEPVSAAAPLPDSLEPLDERPLDPAATGPEGFRLEGTGKPGTAAFPVAAGTGSNDSAPTSSPPAPSGADAPAPASGDAAPLEGGESADGGA